MKTNQKCVLLSLIILFSASASVFAEKLSQQHSHQHDSATQSLSLNNAAKWQIDQSLHLGMTKIQNVLSANLDAIHNNTLPAQQYVVLAKQVDQQLNYLFAHCKLPAEADAQLHILLAKIMRGSALMKNSESQKQGAVVIIQTLDDYPIYFNDASWQAFSH